MANREAGAPVPVAPAPAAPAAPAANAVQRSEQVDKIIASTKPGAVDESRAVADTTAAVKVYGRQYKTDFDDGSVDAPRAMPTVQDVDGAMPRDGEEPEAVVEEKTPAQPFKRSAAPLDDDKPAEAAAEATTEAPAADPAKPALMSRDDRRKLLADLSAESERRTNEQKVHADRQRVENLEAKIKGSLADRLSVVFPELAGQPEAARDRLIEMLVSGQVDPAPAAAAPAPAENDAIADLRRQIEELKGTSPTNPENVAGARLRHVVSTMESNGVVLPFSKHEGDDAIAMGVKVAKSMYAMQGNKGQVDGARVMQVVEEHFEEKFVAKYGQAAADALKGAKPAPVVTETPKVETPAVVQRRPNGRRGTHAAEGNGDHLPLDISKRHRSIMAEIDASEGTVRAGPR